MKRKKSSGKPSRSVAPPGAATPTSSDRRSNLGLREIVNDLVEHVRWISQNLSEMSSEELDYAQERLEWLADEVWRLTVERE